ncbi:MAG: hypothetical protein ABIQ44_15325 [Chloroflexia bacterium]
MIDWTKLAIDVGSITELGERGGSGYAQHALEEIIGEQNIINGVEHVLEGRLGAELVMSVLSYSHSLKALELAYKEYKTSSGQRAATAVWLIKQICHTRSIEWIEEFLSDDNVAGWGVGVLDQLLWKHSIQPEEVEHLIVLAEHHAIKQIREQATFIRQYLKDRGYE